jgi:glycosyltransferase involved in cell wall biosynthesis
LSLDITQGVPNPLVVVRLARLLRDLKPDLLQTWMYHADLLGGITAKIFSGPPVLWNIRNSDDKLSYGRLTALVARLCAHLSCWLPHRIISCSNAGRDYHLKLGYSRSRMRVIFNGYDSDHYRPDPNAAEKLRKELCLGADAKLITHIARYHPVKDHQCFLAAARLVRDVDSAAFFVLCGDGITWHNTQLVDEIDRLKLRECIFLLGRRADVNLVMAAATVVVSSSCSEGFPNVVAEAMACGAICVATDVGDSRHIIGDTGIAVPPNHPGKLAAAVLGVLRSEAISPGARPSGRARVLAHFSMRSNVEKYQLLYEETVAASRHKKIAAAPLAQ